jgi:urease accessory protein
VSTWNAELELRYRGSGGRTTLVHRHRGPLQVQKALYPEGDAACHTIVLHPPGGIAGGDALTIDVAVEPGAHALITTPGAAKWYKANGRQASQRVHLRVEGALEWLPQEAIVFDAADVRSALQIDLGADALMLGWDIVALGRAAAGERFAQGAFAQTIRVHERGELQWLERTRLAGGDALLESPIGLRGARVFGCFWAYGQCLSDARFDALRDRGDDAPLTRLSPRLLAARALGQTTAAVRAALEALWMRVRPMVFEGLAAARPRIWAT